MGPKLLLVCGLAVLMTVPALLVFLLIYDRTSRAEQVVKDVGGLVGGRQTFVGPVLAVPYTVSAPSPAQGQPAQPPSSGTYLIYPAQADVAVDSKSEVRRRSLFQVPVYRAKLEFRTRFDLAGAPRSALANATLNWERAEWIVGMSDPRGAQADIGLRVDGRPLPLAPSEVLGDIGQAEASGPTDVRLRFFGARSGGAPTGSPAVDTTLRFSGASRLTVLPFGKTTHLSMTGDWPNPSFDGGFLPVSRTVTPRGFSAQWSVPFVARGVPAEGSSDTLTRLAQDPLGLSFVQPADPYQSVGRALKYALLFIGLVFLAFFVFEATTGRRVHPAQYVLIGLAQIVFYLLLLSVAERIGFDPAFLLAAAATVGLISAYAGWTFDSRPQGLRALAVFSLLYAMIYGLMRLEDLALLFGAVGSFAAIAAVMYFTRRLNWYEAAALPAPPPSPWPLAPILES